MKRRDFLKAAALSLPIAACQSLPSGARRPQRLFYTSAGKTIMLHADGSGHHVFDFDVPGQATWQPCGFFPDGRRVLFLSMEPRRDGPGKPFEQYYTQTPTHIWAYDLDTDTLTELATQERMAVFYTPALLLAGDRMLVQVVRDGVGQIYNMKLDGADARPFTQAGEGLPYGLSLSPDGARVAFHLASPQGYQVWTSNVEGDDRVKLAAHPEHLYFGTSWSPDGQGVLFVDCHYQSDPGHDWCDVCIARPDGTDMQVLTPGQAMWFSASYGAPGAHGGGSNLPQWTRDGNILFPCRITESRVPWEFQAQRPDTDHFNRDFKPESARGGVYIAKLNPRTQQLSALTKPTEGVWDFRASESPDDRGMVFCRAETGGQPSIWLMDADGRNARLLTHGIDGAAADHPRWMP